MQALACELASAVGFSPSQERHLAEVFLPESCIMYSSRMQQDLNKLALGTATASPKRRASEISIRGFCICRLWHMRSTSRGLGLLGGILYRVISTITPIRIRFRVPTTLQPLQVPPTLQVVVSRNFLAEVSGPSASFLQEETFLKSRQPETPQARNQGLGFRSRYPPQNNEPFAAESNFQHSSIRHYAQQWATATKVHRKSHWNGCAACRMKSAPAAGNCTRLQGATLGYF